MTPTRASHDATDERHHDCEYDDSVCVIERLKDGGVATEHPGLHPVEQDEHALSKRHLLGWQKAFQDKSLIRNFAFLVTVCYVEG